MRSPRVMVTGTRMMGVCRCPDRLSVKCGIETVARVQMASALGQFVIDRITHGKPIELIHGDAEGADRLAAEYWDVHQLGPVQAFPANWSVLGRRAGNVRNAHMVGMMPDVVVAFPWVKRSPGTADAIRRAYDAGIRVIRLPVVQVCPRYAATIDY